jgi:glyoxylase-like metal-dependent hydrolase (beta-lactamase superfamily II)
VSNYKITKVSDDFFLITLAPPLSGFSEFIGIWLYLGVPSFIVDVGPSSTIADLLDAFDKLKVRRLDYILLTHIHLDHAGGIGEFTARFPDTPIVCHQAAISHLLDPTRLWEGTKKVLGPMAEAYGPIRPVSGNHLLNAEQFTSDAVTAIITPGHAPHHVSFKTNKYLFAGETGGVFYSFSRDRFYLRPATPPRFFFETALDSIDLLIESKPSTICYSHCGLKDDAVEMLKIHRKQLFFWKKIIREVIENSGVQDPIEACTRKLLKVDSLTAGFHDLPSAVQEREKYFLQNSIKGFIGDIERGQEKR